MQTQKRRENKMALKVRSVLVTGANRGIGLELIKQFANLPSPPEFIFAGCRSPERAKVSRTNVSICFLTIFTPDVRQPWTRANRLRGDTCTYVCPQTWLN